MLITKCVMYYVAWIYGWIYWYLIPCFLVLSFMCRKYFLKRQDVSYGQIFFFFLGQLV